MNEERLKKRKELEKYLMQNLENNEAVIPVVKVKLPELTPEQINWINDTSNINTQSENFMSSCVIL